MTLRRLQVSDFRCLQSTDIEFDPEFTLISGPNASGKTSLLEAIYVLGRGRSFRTRHLNNLIRSGSDRFIVFGEVDSAGRRSALGVEGAAEGIRGKMDGERVSSLAELAELLPVQIIDPEVHRLIEEGPSRRRRFLDWGVFHVERGFVGQWQKYQQVLRQRNAGLKVRQARGAAAAWDVELVKLGDWIDEARSRYVATLLPQARDLAARLLGSDLHLTYRSGWAQGTTFESALRDSWVRDQDGGSTHVGPQRAELLIELDGAAVKDRVSRGQQKLLAAALLLAQVRLAHADSNVRPTLLLDDPSAELDTGRLSDLVVEVSAQSVQLIVTSLSAQFGALGVPGRQYSVAGGVLRAA